MSNSEAIPAVQEELGPAPVETVSQPITLGRVLAAFFIVPLVGPLFLGIGLSVRESIANGQVLKAASTGFLVSALFAYGMTIVSGIPAWFLCRRNKTASLFTFVRIGAWLGLFWALILTALGLGQRWNDPQTSVIDRVLYDSYAQILLLVFVIAGAASAWLFWCIALRPSSKLTPIAPSA